ncbi:nuclear transport factor 2 family protein [Novosphingobium resinovorum]
MQFTGPAEDRAAIRELMETYADAASRIDKAQWLDCWAPDAEWITSHAEVRGHEALSRTWDDLFATMEAMVFSPCPARSRFRATLPRAAATCAKSPGSKAR